MPTGLPGQALGEAVAGQENSLPPPSTSSQRTISTGNVPTRQVPTLARSPRRRHPIATSSHSWKGAEPGAVCSRPALSLPNARRRRSPAYQPNPTALARAGRVRRSPCRGSRHTPLAASPVTRDEIARNVAIVNLQDDADESPALNDCAVHASAAARHPPKAAPAWIPHPASAAQGGGPVHVALPLSGRIKRVAAIAGGLAGRRAIEAISVWREFDSAGTSACVRRPASRTACRIATGRGFVVSGSRHTGVQQGPARGE